MPPREAANESDCTTERQAPRLYNLLLLSNHHQEQQQQGNMVMMDNQSLSIAQILSRIFVTRNSAARSELTKVY
jgi:hypothetical protein